MIQARVPPHAERSPCSWAIDLGIEKSLRLDKPDD